METTGGPTDQPTHRPTAANQYAFPSSNRSIINPRLKVVELCLGAETLSVLWYVVHIGLQLTEY